MKTHYEHGPHGTACGRASSKTTTNTLSVDCQSCIIRNSFQEAHQRAVLAKERAFLAQTPIRINEPWGEGKAIVVCSQCKGDLFRIGDRTCYGHYDNYHCAKCGNVESRLTETGMSF